MKNAHLAVVPQEGEGKQRRRRPQPEQQIQHEGQGGQADAPAQGAHPVVHQAQQRPDQEPLPEHGRLGRHVQLIHTQRSSRDRNPPREPPTSSS